MNIDKLSKKEIYIEHADGCPNFTEMTAFGFTNNLYNTHWPAYKINFCFYKEREGDWMSFVSDQQHIGKYIIKSHMEDKKYVNILYKKWLINFRKMMKYYYILYKKDLSKLNDKELLRLHTSFHTFYKEKVSMPGFIDGFMFYADKRLDFLVRAFCEKNNISNPQEIFSILSSPIDPSFINEEEYDLIKIAKKLKEKGYVKNLEHFLVKEKKLRKTIDKHLFNYSWIKSSYLGYKKYSIKDVEEEIKRIMETNHENPMKVFKEHEKSKSSLIKRYKFTPEIIAISELTEKLIKWQDQRKNYTLTFTTLQEKFITEISKRTGINLELLRYSMSKEFRKILRKKFDINKLKERQKGCLFIHSKGKIIGVITGEKAHKFLENANRINIDDIKEINGLSASIGKATGKVKIIKSVKQIEKIEKGDILVTPMTRPEHLLAMRKASAIITDDGGITCHAAIVSRELKKPCIIGTRIATKILKDGDLVEVDANQGIVRKLE